MESNESEFEQIVKVPVPIFVTQIFSCAVWAVIGFLIWLPMLARYIAVLTGAMLLAAISQKPLNGMKSNSDLVFSFYVNGFSSILDSYNREQNDEPIFDDDALLKGLGEVVFSVLFWGLGFFAYHLITTEPRETNVVAAQVVAPASYSTREILSKTVQRRQCPWYTDRNCDVWDAYEFQNVSVSAPRKKSIWVRLKFRICGVSENETRAKVSDAYFVDHTGRVAKWREFRLPSLRYGQCVNVTRSSRTRFNPSELDFSDGTFHFNLGGQSNSFSF